MKIPDRSVIENVRKEYPIGTRVELIFMDDPQAPPKHTKGTVFGVDDMANICVHWDNGSGLNVIHDVDIIKKL